MKRKIFLLPFLLLAITKCEEPKKRRRRNSDRKRVKIEKRLSRLYRMKQIRAVAVPAIIILGIGCIISRPKANNSNERSKVNLTKKPTSQVPEFKENIEENKDDEIVFFFEVCGVGEFELVELFLIKDKKKYLFARDKNQNTPLHIAAEKGGLGVVKKLLAVIGEEEDKRKYLKAINNDGDTPLNMVKNALKEEIIDFNAKSEDERRNTRSKIERRKEVVKYLEDYIQKIENPEKQDEKERAS